MSRVSRFMLVAALAVGFGASASRAAEVDALLPKETEQVFYINFKQLLESDLVTKFAGDEVVTYFLTLLLQDSTVWAGVTEWLTAQA